MRRTCVDFEQVSFGAFGIRPLDCGVVDAGLGDGALGVIDDDPARHTAKPVKGMAMTGQPGHRRLIPDDFGILMPGPAEGHDEKPGLADLSGHRINHGGASAEVHLRGLTGCEDQTHGGLRWRYRNDAPQYTFDGRVASSEAMIAHQSGVNGGALNTGCCPSGDLFLMVFEGGNTLGRGGLLAMLLQNGELTVLR